MVPASFKMSFARSIVTKARRQEPAWAGMRFLSEQISEKFHACFDPDPACDLSLAACGSTEHKTVVVTPPEGSTTVVDKNGDAHVITRDDRQ